MLLFAQIYICFWTLNAILSLKDDFKHRNQEVDDSLESSFEIIEDMQERFDKKNVSIFLQIIMFSMFTFVAVGYVLIWFCSEFSELEKNLFVFVAVMDFANYVFGIRVMIILLEKFVEENLNREQILMSMIDMPMKVPAGVNPVIMLGRSTIGISFLVQSFF